MRDLRLQKKLTGQQRGSLHDAKALRKRLKEAYERVVWGEIHKTTRFIVKIGRCVSFKNLAFQNPKKV